MIITILLISVPIILLYIFLLGKKRAQDNIPILNQNLDKVLQVDTPKIIKKNDSSLRRVSICTNLTLFNNEYNLIPAMPELIRLLSTKYRLYLITQVQSQGSPDHAKVQKLLKDLGGDLQQHRIMYCSTAKGKESIVRQLSAEMHIDSDTNFCKNLQRFLSKFHLINEDPEADAVQKESGGKILWFRGVDAYCTKILSSINSTGGSK